MGRWNRRDTKQKLRTSERASGYSSEQLRQQCAQTHSTRKHGREVCGGHTEAVLPAQLFCSSELTRLTTKVQGVTSRAHRALSLGTSTARQVCRRRAEPLLDEAWPSPCTVIPYATCLSVPFSFNDTEKRTEQYIHSRKSLKSGITVRALLGGGQ